MPVEVLGVERGHENQRGISVKGRRLKARCFDHGYIVTGKEILFRRYADISGEVNALTEFPKDMGEKRRCGALALCATHQNNGRLAFACKP